MNLPRILPQTLCLISLPLFLNIAQATDLDVSINTSPLAGTDAQLAFDFIAGDGTILNTVQISNFTSNGTLGTTSDSGAASDLLSTKGIGSLQNTLFFNEILQPIVLGNSINFDVNLSNNFNGTTPDGFSVSLLDKSIPPLPLFDTTDPTGSDTLFLFNIDGTATGNLNVYQAGADNLNPVTWTAQPIIPTPPPNSVPEPTVLWLMAGGLVGFLFKSRKMTF